MRASQFNSREKHEEGLKVFLPLPDGTLTEEFVIISGRDSRAFRKAQSQYRNQMISSKVDEKPFDEYVEGLKLTASSFKSWSLEEELTPEAAFSLLDNAPYLVDLFDNKIYDAKSFFDGKE